MFALPVKWAAQACRKYLIMGTSWPSARDLLVCLDKVKQKSPPKKKNLRNLGFWVVINATLWSFGRSVRDWCILWYFGVGIIQRGMVDQFQKLSRVDFLFFFSLYMGIPEIPLKHWRRKNLLNLVLLVDYTIVGEIFLSGE